MNACPRHLMQASQLTTPAERQQATHHAEEKFRQRVRFYNADVADLVRAISTL